MPEAPRERPAHAVVLHDLHSHIRARPAAVFSAIAARFDPGKQAQSMFLADPKAWFVIVQGGSWYRAEYRIVPDDHGSRLEHALLNVSTAREWRGRPSERRLIESAPAEFERLVVSLKAELE